MTPEKLRSLYGAVSPAAAAKVITRFDHHCRDFIENATFLVMATTNGQTLDVSPKGDPAGFVTVESDTTLLIPDRPGNNRIDGLMNILANPQVALIFLIPTVGETLRVNGRAEILDDPEICARFAVNGRSPKTVTRVTAEKILTHCGKAPIRAGLWKPESWPAERPVATLSDMIRDHVKGEAEVVDDATMQAIYQKTLY
ncbi:MAG: pyridoxamine 5'-phosphate oxidase family protein [Rhodobacteraceae bacterium]|nr:pyridoxamine 5'-phosphate oxidase family protein [Paracoccaceae bacterium]